MSDFIGFPSKLRGRKILLATESLGPINGVSRTTLSLIEYLRDNGVHVAVVAPRLPGKRNDPPKNKDNPELRIHGWPLPYSPDLSVAYPFRLDNICRRTFEPDLIYLASPASVGFQILLQVRQLPSPPAVVLNFQTDLSAYSQILLPKPLDAFGVWLLQKVQGFLFKHWAVNTILYPCGVVRRYIEDCGAPSNKLVHLGRGVDTDLFRPSRKNEDLRRSWASADEIVLLCVGRLAPEKGFDFLASVVDKLLDHGLKFKLVIVGGNQNPMVERKIQSMFQHSQNKVVFTGFKIGQDLAEIYASADLFVHCSITETFGLVVLEAMASGLPVIARDEGGPSEIVLQEKTGYLIESNDLDAFVVNTERLTHDASMRRAFSVAARKSALDTTWEKINNKVAWCLLQALQLSEDRPRTPIRTWISSHPIACVSSLVVLLRLNVAIGIVCFFWLIAVIPLLIHGNPWYPSARQSIEKLSHSMTLGPGISRWLKMKKH